MSTVAGRFAGRSLSLLLKGPFPRLSGVGSLERRVSSAVGRHFHLADSVSSSPDRSDAFSFYLSNRILSGGTVEPQGLRRDFEREGEYFSFLSRTVDDVTEYLHLHAEEREVNQGGDAWRLERRLLDYMARRAQASAMESPEESARRSMKGLWWQEMNRGAFRVFAGGGPFAALDYFNRLVGSYATLFDFVARKLAYQGSCLDRYAERVARDFPQAFHYASGKREAISWEEVESLRRTHLPAREEPKPVMLVAGIGAEWGPVLRSAGQYRLILVDPSRSVAAFFHRRAKLLSDLGVEFFQEDVRSRRIVERFRGAVDAVEYHYCTTPGEDAVTVDRLLKEGGVFCRYHPFPLPASDWTARGYLPLLKKENIPFVLGTSSERLAYPLGNHVTMWKKPPRGDLGG